MQRRGWCGTVAPVVALIGALACAGAASAASIADDLHAAEEMAWAKRFAESEALYRSILERAPRSVPAMLGLARVVMWQLRYAESIALFDAIQPPTAESLEGRATAEYWSGNLRAASRGFRRVLAMSPDSESARRSLAEIGSLAVPSQRVSFDRAHDDQPLSAVRGEVAATFYSDPQTQWTVAASTYSLEAEHVGDSSGESVSVANETVFGRFAIAGNAGVLAFPDGVRRPIGGASLRYGSFLVSVNRREELATATAIRTHAASTSATLRWSHDRDWIAAAEVTTRRYFDGNTGQSALVYAVAPLRRGNVIFWGGASAAFRDTEESRFRMTSMSGSRDAGFFRYQYRGEYDPYWTPDNLVEGRLVGALESRLGSLGLKVHGDAGYARDRGRAFGPDAGPASLPASTFTFAFDRAYRPWRAGITLDWVLTPSLRLEAGAERSSTVDYRSNTIHVALVRRR
jgi:hypothetical protein